MKHLGLGLLLFLLPCLTLQAKVARFDLRDVGSRNLVAFVSDALLERTVGISSTIAGWLELDPEKLNDGIRGEIEIDFRNFQTGIDQRNQMIREKLFVTPEFPIASLFPGKVVSVAKTRLIASVPTELKSEVAFKWRGVTHVQILPFKIVYLPQSEITKQRLPGNLIRLSSTFDLDLGAFNIQIPENLAPRFSRMVGMTIDVVGSDQSPALSIQTDAPKPKE